MPQPSPEVGYLLGAELIDALRNRFPDSTCTHLRTIPATQAEYAPWPGWIHPGIKERLIHTGISAPYTHQAAAANSAYQGNHTVIATGTSSGKSLSYQLPILSTLAAHPAACALYITPTKALGSDQLANTTALIRGINDLSSVHPAPYDGDTPIEARTAIRDTSRFIFTNPDMVHSGILSNHHKWGRLLRNLRFIVIDECHSYRGVFGAHVSLVLRRLLRIARAYGSTPTVILASATTATPADHAGRLIGAPVTAITTDTAPMGARTIALWEPSFIDGAAGECGAPVRRSAPTEAAGMMATLVAEGARTLTFVRSRTQAELVALKTQEELNSHGRFDLSSRIASYRAGYLAEDRRTLEQQLDDGTLLGVATTNALELGIDVGGLDAVITAGFPGTIASFWQQAGRAGRRGQGSIIVLIARDDPLDTYLVHHPEALLDHPVESAVFNPANPYILAGHLYCAALEAPLTDAEISELQAQEVAASLAKQGILRRRANGWFASLPPGEMDPHALVALRGSGSQVTIVDAEDGRVLGTIDQAQACSQVHPGAVYLHQGESFVVDSLDLDTMIALVHPEIPDYYTHARSTTDIRIVREPERVYSPAAGLWVSNLDVEVTNHVIGYMMKSFNGDVIATVPLDLPAHTLLTKAVAYTVDPAVVDALGISDIPGALHAAEHAAIGLLPLFATCDRWDIGGVSTPLHADTGLPTVFVYDGHPGGAGFADCGFARFAEWIAATYEAVRSCACDTGCPSCVQSPKCGNGNSPLDKAGAIKLLGALCTMLDGG
ncbi:MAG: DEAD/DEAH box helicase [Corynebacterium sp.]|uniref:DEAD/DEAH box helicase n=1 Tax=Corynebacterium sp. TaxID=1720 RepID=UPI0026DB03F2|nr:DEAD/DEAH box helicase [Corynebacterium sp.]MDO5099075.1 DEAD/DEAH box helicase [Corynebacterium sp.]